MNMSKIPRIFEVARALKVTTHDVLTYLEKTGYDLPRRQMQPVTEEMYLHLLYQFDRNRFNQYPGNPSLVSKIREKMETIEAQANAKEEVAAETSVKKSETTATTPETTPSTTPKRVVRTVKPLVTKLLPEQDKETAELPIEAKVERVEDTKETEKKEVKEPPKAEVKESKKEEVAVKKEVAKSEPKPAPVKEVTATKKTVAKKTPPEKKNSTPISKPAEKPKPITKMEEIVPSKPTPPEELTINTAFAFLANNLKSELKSTTENSINAIKKDDFESARTIIERASAISKVIEQFEAISKEIRIIVGDDALTEPVVSQPVTQPAVQPPKESVTKEVISEPKKTAAPKSVKPTATKSVKTSPAAPTKSSRPKVVLLSKRGVLTESSNYIKPILNSLIKRGGTAQKYDVIADVEKEIGHIFNEMDLSAPPSHPSIPRWHIKVDKVYRKLLAEGSIISDGIPGNWTITKKGRELVK